MKRLSWIIWVDPKCQYKYPYERDTQREGKKGEEALTAGRDWSGGHIGRNADSCPLEEARSRLPLRASGGRTAWNFWAQTIFLP